MHSDIPEEKVTYMNVLVRNNAKAMKHFFVFLLVASIAINILFRYILDKENYANIYCLRRPIT